jgi:hypothetical protein
MNPKRPTLAPAELDPGCADYCLAYVPAAVYDKPPRFACVHRGSLMNDGLPDWASRVAKWRVWFRVGECGQTYVTRVEGISLEDALKIDLYAMRPMMYGVSSSEKLVLKGGTEVDLGWPQVKPNPYSVDGEAEDGTRDNHIERAPFWVYDAYKGEWSVGWVAGPFATRADAQAWISWKLCGEKGPEPLPMWSRRDVNVNGDAVKLPDTRHIDDMLRAVLDGKTVQHCNLSGDWQDLERERALRLLVTQPGYRYRVKPEPRVQWVGVRASSQLVTDGWRGKVDLAGWAAHNHIELESFLRLEFDPDNGDVKATVEAP